MKAQTAHKLTYGLLLLLSAAGIVASLKIAYLRMLDPDMVHSVLVWQGVQANGLSWLNEWRFTQDNWLFSLIPFQALMVQLGGDALSTLVFSGWLIFFLAAVFSALIARELAGNLAAAITFTLLVWINAYGHIEGFASYAVSHNITNLFGLITLWQLIRWVARPSWTNGILICLLQLMAGLSDPWLLPTFTLPMMLSLVISGLLCKERESFKVRAWLPLLLGLSAVFVLVNTGVFGAFAFMPSMHFSPGPLTTQIENLQTLIGNLGGLFGLLPPLPTAGTNWPETLIQYAGFSTLVIFGLFLCGAKEMASSSQSNRQHVFIGAALFSVLGICSAYVISNVLANVTSSRFVINVLYMVTITIVVSMVQRWPTMRLHSRLLIVGIGAFYLGTSIVSHQRFSAIGWYPQSDRAVNELIQTLDEHGLNYGYGQYHGSKSNAVSVITNGRIIIRPVTYDQVTGQIGFTHPQTAVRWFTSEDAPKDQKRFFVYLTRATQECPDFDQCRGALFRDFGQPAEAIPFEKGMIYVWNHPLINWQPIKVHMGEPIRFNTSMILPPWSGWSITESWGIWSDGDSAFTAFEFASPVRADVKVQLLSRAYAPMIGLDQRIDVYINQQKVAALNYTPTHNEAVREFLIPKEVLGSASKLSIVFGIENAFSPRDKKVSKDTRKLGIGLSEITFTPVYP